MKITGLKINIFSSQHKNAKRNWLIVRIQTDEGVEGIGEASMLNQDPIVASLLEEWAGNYLIGKNPMNGELHWTRLHQDNLGRGGRLFSTALSGIDIALWDLRGKILDVPVYELLGGPYAQKLRVYANGWYTTPGTPEQNAEEAKKVVAMGYTAMKFDPFGKVAYTTITTEEAQLAEDRVAAVREAIGPNVDILVEVHARFNVHTAIHLGKRLEKYNPFWFEEPVSQENVSEMKQVRSKIDIPVATGERLYLKFPFFDLVKNEAVDILQPDICNAGGITELKKIAGMAEAQHIMMAPHNTNSAVGTVASMHLDAAMPNFLIQEYHAEFYEPHYFEVIEGLPRQENGYVDLPEGPGLGLTINEELMNAHPYLPLGMSERGI
ncbi:MAG: mandelate racemase/muconate lactonizing enzyme family protein [SAR202 cluster bacterium]|jgi:galactonate dehydratase|nr:mandelate racemase/muconate lactonizing enzyme family protein [SAR202 cluster bacterium]HJO60490.1 mandelate racemase/muconate lactonizing enzyme family protein [SAR202 cluster bacterium]|tara:strand:- start:22 stop:1161 length:1140 start_codon:yes stop_codon:yes gene_type:complete